MKAAALGLIRKICTHFEWSSTLKFKTLSSISSHHTPSYTIVNFLNAILILLSSSSSSLSFAVNRANFSIAESETATLTINQARWERGKHNKINKLFSVNFASVSSQQQQQFFNFVCSQSLSRYRISTFHIFCCCRCCSRPRASERE
jgi:hypothetical protein